MKNSVLEKLSASWEERGWASCPRGELFVLSAYYNAKKSDCSELRFSVSPFTSEMPDVLATLDAATFALDSLFFEIVVENASTGFNFFLGSLVEAGWSFVGVEKLNADSCNPKFGFRLKK